MTYILRPGDRVHVTVNAAMLGYQPGDKGTVLIGPILRKDGGEPFYIVAMDKKSTYRNDTSNTIFCASEIELDI
jgi:hypothetical protein